MRLGGKVGAGFFQRITAGTKDDAGQFPKAKKSGSGSIGGGEEDVGVEEEPVHETALLWAAVGDGIGIEAHLFDFAAGAIVVGGVCCVGKQEFCFALWSVLFDWDEDSRAKQDAFVERLRGNVGAFFEAKAAAEFCGYDDGAASADAGRIQRSVSDQDVRESVYQILGSSEHAWSNPPPTHEDLRERESELIAGTLDAAHCEGRGEAANRCEKKPGRNRIGKLTEGSASQQGKQWIKRVDK